MLPGGAKGVASGGELWYYHNMNTTELTTEEVLSAFGQRLLPWFRRAARDLPWRHTDDPYAIWVSEIMLQQTRQAPAGIRQPPPRGPLQSGGVHTGGPQDGHSISVRQ